MTPIGWVGMRDGHLHGRGAQWPTAPAAEPEPPAGQALPDADAALIAKAERQAKDGPIDAQTRGRLRALQTAGIETQRIGALLNARPPVVPTPTDPHAQDTARQRDAAWQRGARLAQAMTDNRDGRGGTS
jgi:hypothetical protein